MSRHEIADRFVDGAHALRRLGEITLPLDLALLIAVVASGLGAALVILAGG